MDVSAEHVASFFSDENSHPRKEDYIFPAARTSNPTTQHTMVMYVLLPFSPSPTV
jgi:hypothetical protein